MKFEYSESDVARAALCSNAAVIKARQRNKLNSLADLLTFVLVSRLRAKGIQGVDELNASSAPAESECSQK